MHGGHWRLNGIDDPVNECAVSQECRVGRYEDGHRAILVYLLLKKVHRARKRRRRCGISRRRPISAEGQWLRNDDQQADERSNNPHHGSYDNRRTGMTRPPGSRSVL
jgi:hypothetical protein